MPEPTFIAAPDPTPENLAALARLQPENPFATAAFMDAEKAFRGQPWLLTLQDDGNPILGCLAFIKSGRVNRILSVPSLPAGTDVFWRGLHSFAQQNRADVLELNSFASPALRIPALGEERARTERTEFVVPTMAGTVDLLARMQATHRQRVRKGIKAGLEVRTSSGEECLADHVRLMSASMRRRSERGEIVPDEITPESIRPYLETGWCTIYQAVMGGEVFSSMMVASAKSGGYLHTSGTSPNGMAIGASHYLIYRILLAAQERGASVFNLGGVTDSASTLADYKRYFGAETVALEAAEFYMGNALNRILNSSISVLRRVSGPGRGRSR